jgi:hypothetical protein
MRERAAAGLLFPPSIRASDDELLATFRHLKDEGMCEVGADGRVVLTRMGSEATLYLDLLRTLPHGPR